MSNPITRRGALVGVVASVTTLALAKTSTAASESTVHDVTIKGFAFEPANIQVRIGDTIRWTNDDLAPHTATADEFGWDTEEIASGGVAEIVVESGMETSYFCAYHPHMKGTFEIV